MKLNSKIASALGILAFIGVVGLVMIGGSIVANTSRENRQLQVEINDLRQDLEIVRAENGRLQAQLEIIPGFLESQDKYYYVYAFFDVGSDSNLHSQLATELQAAGFEVEYTSTEQAKQEFKQSGRLDNNDINLDDYELPASITIKARNAEENKLAKSLINQEDYPVDRVESQY